MSAHSAVLRLPQIGSRLLTSMFQWRSLDAPYHDLSGKIVLVTGGARGIGAEVARLLAGWNAHVLLACRRGAQGESLREEILSTYAGARVTVLDGADTADLEAMADLAERTKAVLGGAALDGLVLNAGIAGVRCTKSKQGYESHVATNVLGHHLLALSLLDDLAKTREGRIVYVTGDIYVMSSECTLDFEYPDVWSTYAYARSKLGVSWNALSMQEHLASQGSPVRSVAVHPGVVSSELLKGADSLKRLLLITPQKSARSIVFALTDEGVKGGDYLHNVHAKMTLPANDPVLREDARRRFWRACNEACEAWLSPKFGAR